MRRTELVLAAAGAALCAGVVWFALSPIDTPAQSPDAARAPWPATHDSIAAAIEAEKVAPDASIGLDAAGRAAADRAGIESGPPFDAGTAIWVEGRVIFPPATPADERAQIIAVFKSEESTKPHRAAVASDGAFRVAFPAGTKSGRLELAARYLFLYEPYRIDSIGSRESIVLEPELGGFVHLVFVVPAESADRRADLVGMEMTLTAASKLRTGNASRFPSRTVPVEFASHVDIGGIIPEITYEIGGEPSTFAPFTVRGVRAEPGSVTTLEAQLENGIRLRGRVVDESAQPIAGATFQIEVHAGNESTSIDRDDSTGAEGTFAFRGIRAGKIKLSVAAPGYLATIVRLDSPADGGERGDVEVVLKRGLAIRGRVQWPDKSAASGATVTIDLSSTITVGNQWDDLGWSDIQETVAAADGTFEFRGLTAGPFELAAQSPSGERTGFTRVEGVSSDGKPVVMTLDEGREVRGRVIDDTGGGAAHFTVEATPASAANGTWGVPHPIIGRVLGDDGSFVFDALGVGNWSIAARGKASVVRRVCLIPSDETALEILLPRAASISGVVLDPDGEPVRGARVAYAPKTSIGAPEEQRVTANLTRADGQFAFEAVSPGPGTLTASHFRWATSESESFDLIPGDKRSGIVVKLRASGRLTGEVRSGDGRPDPMRPLFLNPRSGATQISAYFESDAAGRFELEGLPAGDYTLRTSSSAAEREAAASSGDQAGPQNVAKPVNFTLVAGQTTHVLLGDKPRAPVRLTGRVSARDRAVAGASVSAFVSGAAKRARTDGDGRYELALDEPGEYWFTVTPSGTGTNVQRKEIVPEVAQMTLDFELPGGRIAGRVTTPGGEPARDMRVQLRAQQSVDPTSNAMRTDFGHMVTEDDGRFAFESLLAGTYRVQATETLYFGTEQLAQYAPITADDLVLAEDSAIEDVSLQLEPAGQLEIDVVGPTGEPSAGAEVFTFDESGAALQDYSGKITDAAGHMRVGGLPSRPVFVFARKQPLVSAVFGPVRVRELAGQSLKLELRPGTRLDVSLEASQKTTPVSVLDERGIDFARIWSRASGMALQTARDTAVGPLPPGRYRVGLREKDLQQYGIDVVVAGEEKREVKLTVPPQPKPND